MKIITQMNTSFDYHVKSVDVCCKKMSEDIFSGKRCLFIQKADDTNRVRVLRPNSSEITFCPHCGNEIVIIEEKDTNETERK